MTQDTSPGLAKVFFLPGHQGLPEETCVRVADAVRSFGELVTCAELLQAGSSGAVAELDGKVPIVAFQLRLPRVQRGLDELARAVATKTYAGDVIDMELPDAVKACRQGLLEHIDPATLPAAADGTPAARDFVAGALGPCWVGEVLYALVIVAAPDNGAKTLADFFDLT